jgi:MraZ protein
MFRGAAKVTIDDKGRVVVPARYRTELAGPAAGRVFMTADRDECLLIYAAPEWERIEEQLNAAPNVLPHVRRTQRMMLAHAEELMLDSHGRLTITPEHREFAGLARAAWLVGVGKHLELWDEARWKMQRDAWTKGEQGATELAAVLGTLSL